MPLTPQPAQSAPSSSTTQICAELPMAAHPPLARLDGALRLRRSRAVHRARPLLQVPHHRRQLQLWLGDRPHRLLSGQRSRIQFALRRRHRPFRLDRARLSLDRLARLSRLRQLLARRILRAAHLQQPVRGADLLGRSIAPRAASSAKPSPSGRDGSGRCCPTSSTGRCAGSGKPASPLCS